jgi:hypothetical protein
VTELWVENTGFFTLNPAFNHLSLSQSCGFTQLDKIIFKLFIDKDINCFMRFFFTGTNIFCFSAPDKGCLFRLTRFVFDEEVPAFSICDISASSAIQHALFAEDTTEF